MGTASWRFGSHRLRDEPQYRDVRRQKDTMERIIDLMQGLWLKEKIRKGPRTMSTHITVH